MSNGIPVEIHQPASGCVTAHVTFHLPTDPRRPGSGAPHGTRARQTTKTLTTAGLTRSEYVELPAGEDTILVRIRNPSTNQGQFRTRKDPDDATQDFPLAPGEELRFTFDQGTSVINIGNVNLTITIGPITGLERQGEST